MPTNTGNIWTAADPPIVADATAYELGTVVQALRAVTLTGVRILGDPLAPARPGRMARLWNPLNSSLVTSVALPDTMPAGWHTVAVSVPMAAGDMFVVTYDTQGRYAAAPNALATAVVAPDQAMRMPAGPGNGRFATVPGSYPASFPANSTFYGVDVTYSWEGEVPPPPPPPPGEKRPNAEQVAVAWLNSLSALEAPAATNRPAGTDWSATGFVVASVVGDGTLPDSPSEAPIISADTWAVRPGASNPPHGHAAGLAQIIRKAALEFSGPVRLTMPAGFRPVIVTSAWSVSGLRRIPEPDGSSYAHYAVDFGLRWTEALT